MNGTPSQMFTMFMAIQFHVGSDFHCTAPRPTALRMMLTNPYS